MNRHALALGGLNALRLPLGIDVRPEIRDQTHRIDRVTAESIASEEAVVGELFQQGHRVWVQVLHLELKFRRVKTSIQQFLHAHTQQVRTIQHVGVDGVFLHCQQCSVENPVGIGNRKIRSRFSILPGHVGTNVIVREG